MGSHIDPTAADPRVALQIDGNGLCRVPIPIEVRGIRGQPYVLTRDDAGRGGGQPEIIVGSADDIVRSIGIQESG